MAEPKEITVSWPPLALGTAGWINRLNDLAADAELLVGRKQIGLQESAELALQCFGLLWPAMSVETIAGSCRASALLKMPVFLSSAPADQVQEVAERLDAIYAAAQADPAALVVELQPPMMQQVRPPDPRIGKKQRQRVHAAEPEDHPVEPQPLPEWEPDDHPVELADSPDPVAADHPVEPAPAPAEDPDDLPAAWMDCATPAPAPPTPAADVPAEALEPMLPLPPAPKRRLRPLAERLARSKPEPAAEPPPGWFTAADVAELLDVEPCSIARWRKAGRFGNEGTGWQQCGRGFYFDPDAVENIDKTRIPSGLDQLVAEIQAL